jgi:hypothetical protein
MKIIHPSYLIYSTYVVYSVYMLTAQRISKKSKLFRRRRGSIEYGPDQMTIVDASEHVSPVFTYSELIWEKGIDPDTIKVVDAVQYGSDGAPLIDQDGWAITTKRMSCVLPDGRQVWVVQDETPEPKSLKPPEPTEFPYASLDDLAKFCHPDAAEAGLQVIRFNPDHTRRDTTLLILGDLVRIVQPSVLCRYRQWMDMGSLVVGETHDEDISTCTEGILNLSAPEEVDTIERPDTQQRNTSIDELDKFARPEADLDGLRVEILYDQDGISSGYVCVTLGEETSVVLIKDWRKIRRSYDLGIFAVDASQIKNFVELHYYRDSVSNVNNALLDIELTTLDTSPDDEQADENNNGILSVTPDQNLEEDALLDEAKTDPLLIESNEIVHAAPGNLDDELPQDRSDVLPEVSDPTIISAHTLSTEGELTLIQELSMAKAGVAKLEAELSEHQEQIASAKSKEHHYKTHPPAKWRILKNRRHKKNRRSNMERINKLELSYGLKLVPLSTLHQQVENIGSKLKKDFRDEHSVTDINRSCQCSYCNK